MLTGGPVRQPYSYSVPSPHILFKISSTVVWQEKVLLAVGRAVGGGGVQQQDQHILILFNYSFVICIEKNFLALQIRMKKNL
jgi:hypothetical protein